MPEDGGENPTVEQVRRRVKWDNDDYVCRGLILNGFKHTLKHLKEELTLIELGSHLRIKESLKVQDSDKPNGNNIAGPSVVNMVEHNNFSRYNDNKGTKGSGDGSSNHLKGPNMFNKSFQIYYVTYVSEVYFVQDDDVAWWVDSGATVHVCKDRCRFKTYESLNDGSIHHMGNESTSLVRERGCVDIRLGHVHFKRMQDMSKDRLIPAFDMNTEKCKTCMLTKITKKPFQNVKTKVVELIHNDLYDLHATHSLGNKKYFMTFIDDASRFYYVYLLHTKDEALDKFKLFKIDVELQQGSLIKRFRTVRGGEYMYTLYFQSVDIIHETTTPYTPQQNVSINSIIELRDVVFDQHRFSSVPKPSQRSLKDGTEDSGSLVVSERVTEEVDLTKEFLSSRFSMKDTDEADVILGIKIKYESNGIAISKSYDIKKVLKKFNYSDCTPVSTPLDTCEKLMPNKGLTVSQLEYSRVIGCLMYAMTCTRPDIAFVVDKLSSNIEDNSSTSGWVFLLGGGAISWAFKKQTCITGSTMESEFVALAAAGKEAKRLKNLLLEIPLWVKPMAPISIRCDSVATLAKAYSQMYNGKSRHLGIRHSMIRELIANGVVSIEFNNSINTNGIVVPGFLAVLVFKLCVVVGDCATS
nr:zinc finger, CCHC-type [Tanacetum cinerariifolium]